MLFTFFCKLLIATFVIAIVVIATLWVIHRYYDAEHERHYALKYRVDIAELFVALDFIIKTEIELYEAYLRDNTDKDLTTINNTEFVNIYKDLARKCLEAPSEQFWKSAEVYMGRESIQTYITQRVYSYLADKVKA